jgi:hypothetical protein
MSKLHWSLLVLYVTAAAAYGGWRGRHLWSGWGVWCLLLPPVVAAALTAFAWRRKGGPLGVGVVMGGVSAVGIGGAALGIAWGVAEATGRWAGGTATNTANGAAFGAAGIGLAWAAQTSREAAKPRELSGSDGAGGPADPGATPDRGGK